MPHRAMQELRTRYVTLNGVRPTPPGTLSNVEDVLGLAVPDDLLRVCEFYDGTGVVSESVARISAATEGETVVALTRQFRSELALPQNFLVLGASDTTVLLLDCAAATSGKTPAVHRVHRADVPKLAVGHGLNGARSWPTFSDYFRELLDQEEVS